MASGREQEQKCGPNASLEVIGVGWGRTGTFSLKNALETLGFGKCYHMTEVLANERDDVSMWEQVIDNGPSTAAGVESLEQIFDGYHSCTDWPAVAFWETLFEMNPHAKFVLTVRDPEDWYTSVQGSIGDFLEKTLAHADTSSRQYRQCAMSARLPCGGKTLMDVFKSRDLATKSFSDHMERVKETIPESQLLIFRPEDGWQALCNFLNVPIPNQPFSHRDATKEIEK